MADWIEGGRTRHALLETEGESWVLKAYRRGGAVGALNSARYWGPQRFLRELEVAWAAVEDLPEGEIDISEDGTIQGMAER